MWLEVFHQNYSRAARRYYRLTLEPSELERELSWMRKGTVKIASVIGALEQSRHWSYTKWWPPVSEDVLGDPISIPEDLSAEESRKRTIRLLHDRLKNIECVSTILRFLRPEQFGIISFPVTNLINLPQAKNATDYYLTYLRSLRRLRKHCGGNSLPRVADIDMALWSAAHFSQDADLGPGFEDVKKATEEMRHDKKFQELRFQNLLSGLQLKQESLYQQKSTQLVFVRALLEHDYQLASVITAKVYESLIDEIGRYYKLPAAEGGDRTTGKLIEHLERKGIPKEIGIAKGKLFEWWGFRKQAVHEQPEPLSSSKAQKFAAGVGELLIAWNNRPIRS